MSVFADSSALVRLYVDEPDADRVRQFAALAVSGLARVEVTSALWRKAREGVITSDDALLLERWFSADWFGDGHAPPRFAVVAVGEAVLERATALVRQHALRSLDAIQLAAALVTREAVGEPVPFACFDTRLRVAAQLEGFTVVP